MGHASRIGLTPQFIAPSDADRQLCSLRWRNGSAAKVDAELRGADTHTTGANTVRPRGDRVRTLG